MLGSTSPSQRLNIRAEARKSFSFAIWIKDTSGRLLDITGTTIRLVAKKPPLNGVDDSDNLIANSTAELVSPVNGYARFSLQASDLDHRPDEYPYSIVLYENGYSSVLAKGVLEIVQNSEIESINESYDPVQPVSAIQVTLRGRRAIEVHTGSTLAPGTTSFLLTDKAKLESIEVGAQAHIPSDWDAGEADPGFIANKPALGTAAYVDTEDLSLPPGGAPGEFLMKTTAANFDVMWSQPPGAGGGGVDPTGVPAGYVPTTTGLDTWSWQENLSGVTSVNMLAGDVFLSLEDIPDSASRWAMTTAQRDKLENIVYPAVTTWASVTGKPTFGTAAALNTGDIILKNGINASTDFASGTVPVARLPKPSAQNGFSWGTSAPTGGADGDLYFQYTV